MTTLKFRNIQTLFSNFSKINFQLYSSEIKQSNFIDLYSMSTRQAKYHVRVCKAQERRALAASSPPSFVSLEILGNGARGAPSSLYVSTDHKKYIFNCGEGTQRLAHEYHLRLTKLEDVFFTSATWKNMGGLPGMILTIQDMGGSPDIFLHGPKGIRRIFDAVKKFASINYLNVQEAKCSEDEFFVDSCMKIRYVHLKTSTPEVDSDNDYDDSIDDNTNYYAHEINDEENKVKRQKIFHELKKKENEHIDTSKSGRITGCVTYICKLHPKRGALNLELCVDKGITPGPILGKLKAGEDVTLDDGTVVKSSDVCYPTIPGPVFIVTECPNENYLDSLVENEVFKNYQENASDPADIAKYVVHFSPPEIIEHPRYMEWMMRFGNTTQHLFINKDNNYAKSESAQKIQHQLNLLHPKIFPILQNENPTVPDLLDQNKHLKIHRAKALNVVYIRPDKGIDCRSEPVFDSKSYMDELFATDGFVDTLTELQTNINSKSQFIDDSPEFPKIVMLGTGSCIPNKIRNTSGILLRVNKDTNILMDCGEGTAGQLWRFFGPEKIGKILSDIKAVFISHLHADHHLGLLGILQTRQQFTDQPIHIIAPNQLESWLYFYEKRFERMNLQYNLIPNQLIVHNERRISDEAFAELQEKLHIDDVCTVHVYHCSHAFGVAWKLKSGEKIVYSGDTRPCRNLVEIGKNCDLLIHEATMEDELSEEARKKMHSTVSEALSIGKIMEAKFILLTHFSQRYSKLPRLPTENVTLNNVGIAYDNMEFNMAQLSLLPFLYPTLKIMFSDFYSELEAKAQRRDRLKKNMLRTS